MSRASLRRNGPRSGLSREDSSRLIVDFCGSGFFLPELRSGEGLTREEEGEGEGGARFGAGEEGRIWVVDGGVVVVEGGVVVERESVGGGVFAETIPGIFITFFFFF